MTDIAGPITVPHPAEACYQSRLHCHSHDTDEPDSPCYRACMECCHVWRTPAGLLAAHNEHLAVYGEPPETDTARVFCCPACTHSW